MRDIHVTPLRNQRNQLLMRFNKLQTRLYELPARGGISGLAGHLADFKWAGFWLHCHPLLLLLYGASIAAIALNVNWCLDTNVFW